MVISVYTRFSAQDLVHLENKSPVIKIRIEEESTTLIKTEKDRVE
jgi:hypothetical protein